MTELRVLYAPETDEIKVSGDRDALAELGHAIDAGTGRFVLDQSGDPAPYDLVLGAVEIDTVPSGKVVVASDVDRSTLTISGERSALSLLARNVLGLAEDGTVGEHAHIDYFPDHFYLSPDSAPAVLTLESTTAG
ncbi:hypothetical protein ALI22I_07900 [Saccharothrix sp. ALI-22-I]|uniref:Imm32 family immunity protein n=1 Tax=Saccharothrix sp. ALI-22-I TaxID=1933778 RepID=UPI00097BDB8D|nr:hypothetical protein [Saccharothrix sp. ALI-22-I]ONI91548.1 hypothetical protein ALI22I_07900 [Saccharothrix sp. ALI-22-I]